MVSYVDLHSPSVLYHTIPLQRQISLTLFLANLLQLLMTGICVLGDNVGHNILLSVCLFILQTQSRKQTTCLPTCSCLTYPICQPIGGSDWTWTKGTMLTLYSSAKPWRLQGVLKLNFWPHLSNVCTLFSTEVQNNEAMIGAHSDTTLG